MKKIAALALILLPFTSPGQHTSIGLRAGVNTWRFLHEPIPGEPNQTGENSEKEIFFRGPLGKRWLVDLAIGHTGYRDHYTFNVTGYAGERTLHTQIISVGASAEYNLLAKKLPASRSALYGGVQVAAQYADRHAVERSASWGGEMRTRDYHTDATFLMIGPLLTYTFKVAGPVSLLTKAYWQADAYSAFAGPFNGRDGARIPKRAGLSAGLFYTF